MLELPKSKVAAVQAAPVFLDPAATVDKACALIAEAARNGAKLIAFPEVFVAGYPYWNWLMTPIEGSAWFERMCRASITVPGPEVDQLCAAAREHDCVVVIGVNERDLRSVATIYNTNLIIGVDGTLLGKHRKLVPTWAEKLTWAGGDGSSLRVYDTPVGPLGTLACGENTNTLARFALLSAGELVHVANYIALPVAPASYDMATAIRIRAAAHSFEGKVFTIVACSTVSEEIIAAMSVDRPSNRGLLRQRRHRLCRYRSFRLHPAKTDARHHWLL
jgi:nitrilase